MKPVRVLPGGVPEPMSALDRIKIIENHEPLVDIRIACPRLTFPIDAGKEGGMTTYLRQTAAQMLREASEKIPKEYRLHAVSAWRSFERQKDIWWSHYNRHKEQNPHRSEEHTSELQSLMRISYAVFCLKNT